MKSINEDVDDVEDNDDEDDDVGGCGEDKYDDDDSSSEFSLKCSSPNISVKEGCSGGFMDLIWFHDERVSMSVGFSGNGFSKMC